MKTSPYQGLLLRNIAFVWLLSGNPDEAKRLCQQALRVSDQFGDVHGLAQAHMVMCALYLHLARFTEAYDHANQMLKRLEETSLATFRAIALTYLARSSAEMGTTSRPRLISKPPPPWPKPSTCLFWN